VIAPRYHVKFYPYITGAIVTLIDPAGKRFDMNGGPGPKLKVMRETKDGAGGETKREAETVGLRPYREMFPKAYSEKARAEGWIEERDQLRHEGAPFKYRFEADWLALQYYQAGASDKYLQVEWWRPKSLYPARLSGQGKVFAGGAVSELVVAADKEVLPRFPQTTKAVDAVFLVDNTREYGLAELYPSGTEITGRGNGPIQFPVQGWFGIAFCNPGEFEELARRWVAARDRLEVE
jgi:hypothetical protein